MTRGDRIVVLVVVALAAAVWPIAGLASGGGSGSPVAVVTGPDASKTLPLTVSRSISVRGLDGTVTVETTDRSVRVASSSCPDQLCVQRGSVRDAGSAIVCAPNGVTVRITGRSDAPDAVIR